MYLGGCVWRCPKAPRSAPPPDSPPPRHQGIPRRSLEWVYPRGCGSGCAGPHPDQPGDAGALCTPRCGARRARWFVCQVTCGAGGQFGGRGDSQLGNQDDIIVTKNQSGEDLFSVRYSGHQSSWESLGSNAISAGSITLVESCDSRNRN